MDPFMSLIGAVPQEEEAQAALAQQLRKQQGLGQIMQLSGDSVLSPLGGSMNEQALGQAEQIGKNRMVQDQQRGLQKWRESQAEFQGKQLDSNERLRLAQIRDVKQRQDEMDLLRQEKFDYQKSKEARTASSKIGKLINDDGIDASVPAIQNLRKSLKGYMDRGEDVPGVSQAFNIPGFQSLSTAFDKDAERIVQMKALVVNPILKARSGAAVTDQELKRLMDEIEGAKTEQGLLDGLDGLESYLKSMADNHINSNSYGRDLYIEETGIGADGYWQVGGSPKASADKTAEITQGGDSGWSDTDEARMRELEAQMNGS